MGHHAPPTLGSSPATPSTRAQRANKQNFYEKWGSESDHGLAEGKVDGVAGLEPVISGVFQIDLSIS